MIEEYNVKKRSITYIANLCNENYGYIRRKLIEFNISIRTPWEHKDKAIKRKDIGKLNASYKNGNYCKNTIHYCIEEKCNNKVSGVNKRCRSCAAKFRNKKG